jgi:hypothetical protein
MSQPLPEDKKNKLSEKIADDFAREFKRHENDLTKREVSPSDANEIIEKGLVDGYYKYKKENQ